MCISKKLNRYYIPLIKKELSAMFFKKKDKSKKRVVCPIPVIMGLIQESVDIDAGSCEFVILFDGREHKVGFSSDYNRKQGFFDPLFYFDGQEFDDFIIFKSEATLNGQIFSQRTDDVEIIEADNGAVKFPWYKALEAYVTE